MDVLGKQTRLTAPQLAYQWLHEAVTKLPWDEEAFLSENAVAEASGTSRTPVREALLRLESEGLLRRVPHKGAYVPPLSEKDIDSMMEARRVIEEWAVRKFTETEISTDRLRALLAKQADTLADPTAFIQCDTDFHRNIVRAARNPILGDLYDSLRFKQLRMGMRAVLDGTGRDGTGRGECVLAEHNAIIDGIQSGDPGLAVRAVVDHLGSTLAALKSIPSSRESDLEGSDYI